MQFPFGVATVEGLQRVQKRTSSHSIHTELTFIIYNVECTARIAGSPIEVAGTGQTMEEEFGNMSNSSATTCQATPDPTLTAFHFAGFIVLVAIILLNGLVAIMLLQAKSVALQVRVLLLNLLVAILIVAVVWLCVVIYSLTLALGYASEPSLPFCRFAVFIYTLTAQARILGLVLFSTMVLQPVTCGTTESGRKWLIFSLVPCWAIAFLLSVRILVPEIYGVQYVGCIACFPSRVGVAYGTIGLAISFFILLIGCVVPLLLCICIPLGTLCYIKRHPISEGEMYGFYAKFAALLIPGSLLTVLTQIVAIILAVLSTDIVGVYVSCTLTYLSYIPTPILVVVFLKPVQKQLRHLFCKKCQKHDEAIPMKQAEIPSHQFDTQQTLEYESLYVHKHTE